jgi:hypothetical protein
MRRLLVLRSFSLFSPRYDHISSRFLPIQLTFVERGHISGSTFGSPDTLSNIVPTDMREGNKLNNKLRSKEGDV